MKTKLSHAISGWLVLGLALSWVQAAPPKEVKREVFLGDQFPPILEADRALKEVPYAAGAPGVVLLDAQQDDFELAGDDYVLRMRYFRRVKILTEAGAQDYGNFIYDLYGDWRVKKVLARTVLPDGVEVDAGEGVFYEKSNAGTQVVRIAFPQVRVGAILDVMIHVNSDSTYVSPWLIQELLPVLESRYVLIPPRELRYRTAVLRMPQDQNKPEQLRIAGLRGSRNAFVWRFKNVAPIPDEAHRPPLFDVSQTLLIIPVAYEMPGLKIPLGESFKAWSENRRRAWNDWMDEAHGKTQQLARQVCADRESVPDKLEAIGRALSDRVRIDYYSTVASLDSPDAVLEQGVGSSADVAATAATMARAVGVPAELAALRRRSTGVVPASDVPLFSLYNDLAVSVPTNEGRLFWSPTGNVEVGSVPWEWRGTDALIYDGKAEAPVAIPDFKASENRIERVHNVKLDPQGNIEGQSTETYQGVSAEIWRAQLRNLDDEAREELIREELREFAETARIDSFDVQNVDGLDQPLVVRYSWRADAYGTIAGKRMLVNLNLRNRPSAEAWAAIERRLDIDLGWTWDTLETVLLELPAEVVDITVPGPASMKADPVGNFEASYTQDGSKLKAQRRFQVEMWRFPAESYRGLKEWMSAIAEWSDKPVALTLQ